MRHFLIIDSGGTKTTAVVFNDQGEPITDFIVKSSRTYEGEDAVFQNTVELAYEVLEAAGMKKEDIATIGVTLLFLGVKKDLLTFIQPKKSET